MRYLLLNIRLCSTRAQDSRVQLVLQGSWRLFPSSSFGVICCAQVGCESGCSEISQCSIPALFRFGCKNVRALSHHEKTHEKGQCHSWVQ